MSSGLKTFVGNLARRFPGVGALIVHRDQLLRDRDQLISQRQALSDERDELLEQRNDLDRTLAKVALARDQLLQQTVDLERSVGPLRGERDQLQALYTAAAAHRDELYEQAVELTKKLEPRTYLAHQYLTGSGIEIGALFRPTPVPDDVKVTFVDRYGVADLEDEYSTLVGVTFVEPDVIDDGERLERFESNSLDFVIANHFLEHCQDPIGTLLTFADRLRTGGIIYLAIPNKRKTFDRARPVTSIEHLQRDRADGPDWSRRDHFLEYAEYCEGHWGDGIAKRADELEATDYAIHFHAFDPPAMFELMNALHRDHCSALEVVAALSWSDEVIMILRKGGDELDRAVQ